MAPIHPAAYYIMGGIRTDFNGTTSVPGADRLASNSLLEGVVSRRRAGEAMLEAPSWSAGRGRTFGDEQFPTMSRVDLQTPAWEGCGIARNAKGLAAVLDRIDHGGRENVPEPTRADYEKRNIATVLRLIAKAALVREESRGGHYREDFPQKAPEALHSSLRRGQPTRLIGW